MEQAKSLIVYLGEIEDPHQGRGKRHEQLSILVLMIMAMLCGKTSLKSIARFAKAHHVELGHPVAERKSALLQHVSASEFTDEER